jgi:drug/metabolite transporter (DMT)-like permease
VKHDRQSSAERLRFNPIFILILGVVAVSSGAIFVRLADSSPLVTAAWRMTLATLVLLPYAFWKARGELRQLSRRELGLGALAGFFLALHFATWISSLNFTSVANSTVLVNSTPVWVAIMTPWLTRDHVSRRAWLGIATSVAGGIVIGLGDFAAGTRALLGDGLALAGSLALAFYMLCGRNLRARLSLPAYLTVCYSSATILLWACVLVAGQPATGFNAKTWGALFGMALVSQHLGHSSYNWAMKYFSAGFIAVCLLGEPVLSSLLAWWLFDEALTWGKAAGGALILAGIYLAATASNPFAKSRPNESASIPNDV